jgi:hypothetical protein
MKPYFLMLLIGTVAALAGLPREARKSDADVIEAAFVGRHPDRKDAH